MIKEIELEIYPQNINDAESIRIQAAKKLELDPLEVKGFQVTKRSIDSRSRRPVFRVRGIAFINENPKSIRELIVFNPVKSNKKVIIIGSGPAGLFAAMKLIELGIKPIIVERGKDVQSRRKDLREIQQNGIVNPDSNYCFGEGGAGAYSDGKLYTRSNKRGDVNRILNLFVQHGAQNEIMIDAHPHIGSNVLPKVVQNIRATILESGGEFHFESKVTNLVITDKKISGVIINENIEILGDAVIVATGHSARDIYNLFHNLNLTLSPKSFAVGVRIEHPQSLIDQIQYHTSERHPNLPASSYALACQVDDNGVYSFCMCPGGVIIPASTGEEELVLNGMSVSRRDSPFANSGIVVSVEEKDWREFSDHRVFAGIEYQKQIERAAFEAGGKTQRAPAQRITDFVVKKISSSLPATSYIPGVVSYPIHEILPRKIVRGLAYSLKYFDKRMKGYFTEAAQILAAETRTSSPIRIPRDKETMMHPDCEGLIPCGEGAGYAGGIVSAAIDGERCAEAAVKKLER